MNIEPCTEPPPPYARSTYGPILQWLVNAKPGEWMRIPVSDPHCPTSANVLRAVYHHLRPLRATTRKTAGFLYVGKREKEETHAD